MNSQVTLFQQALVMFQQKNYDLAQQMCNQSLLHNKESNTYHLLALINKAQQKFSDAINNFDLSLKLEINQPQVHANFANLLQAQGHNSKAEHHYQYALKLAPNFIDAHINYSLFLSKDNQTEKALLQIEKARSAGAEQINYYQTKAKIYEQSNNLTSAENCYVAALQHNNDNFILNYNLACIYRKLDKHQEALQSLLKIYSKSTHIAEVNFVLGCIYYDLGNIDLSEKYLQLSIKIKVDYIEAHEALNKLYWEQDIKDKFLHSYDIAVQKKSNNANLNYSKIAQLIMSDNIEQAEQETYAAIKSFGTSASFNHLLGVINNKQSNTDTAFDFFAQAVKMAPNTVRYQIDIANLLIKNYQYKEALQHLNIAGNLANEDQEVWAYKGVCWRLTNDEKAAWLNNYDQFVHTEFLSVPDKYDNLSHFVAEIELALLQLHNSQQQPLDQSVRGGTQTVGQLLNSSVEVIKDYKFSLSTIIDAFIKQLPHDNNHPFLRRNTGKFDFTGSWSVKLMSNGFHSNHIHPVGWLSGPTYISVPNEISIDDSTHAGWVKLGETSLALGDREEIGKAVCPQPGLVVLFPSYMWHGTVPFISNSSRITTPCDVKPV